MNDITEYSAVELRCKLESAIKQLHMAKYNKPITEEDLNMWIMVIDWDDEVEVTRQTLAITP